MAAFSSLAQVVFFILLSQTNVILAQTQCIEHEKDLLLELKDQLVFDSSHSIRLARWNRTNDCCTWHGVGCDRQGHVISLGLGEESISGGLNESSSLFSLNYLEQLHLAGNLLSGSLPYSFGNLNRLTHLDLSNCSFSGPIPFTLSNLTQLVELDLSNNFFSGSILSTLSNLTLLVLMDMSYNNFTGSISYHHLQGLSDVTTIDLSSNSLSGTIPLPIFTLPSLQQLRLDHNQFSGQISEFPIVNMSTLQLFDLDLSSNQLESPIPNSFFSLRGLEYLYLSHNLFDHTFQLEKILSLPILYHLNLSSNNLQSLDEVSSYRLSSSLDTLDLSDNRIAGEVPSWIWEIGGGTLFYLNLSCNMLVDLQKPNNLSASLSLQVLDLHSNQLRGELPPPPQQASYVDYSNNYFDSSIPNIGSFSGDNLQFLSLANNRLSGPIPTFGCNSTHLEVLDLSVNNLSGRIPPCLFQNFGNLIVLNLRRNNITGLIPHNISPHCSLRSLDLSHNNLVGEVPLSLGNCNSLTVMNVGNNHIHGTFPCMLPSSLQVLVLRSNGFHGGITCRKKSWPNLQIIDIASNHFSGNLNALNFSSWRGMMRSTVTRLSYKTLGFSAFDSWGYYQTAYRTWGYYRDEVNLTIKGEERRLVKIWPDFTCIDFSCNDFDGDIPDSIGGLDGLYLLNLSHNSLAGTIPTSFSKLTFLGALDLSVNRLDGKIPREIAGLTFLAAMNVSYNKLVGEIPSSTQIHSFSADCFEGNLGLCGLPLNIACSNINPVSPPPPGNEGSEKEIEWGYMFAAAGYAVGLGSFSWLLLFCRSFRYKYFEKVDDSLDKIFYRHQHNKRRDRRRRRAVRNEIRRQ